MRVVRASRFFATLAGTGGCLACMLMGQPDLKLNEY
jgi:hypothetical protein